MPVEARADPRPLPNPPWLGKLMEEIFEPDLPIIASDRRVLDAMNLRFGHQE
jgi:hypothetical protein